MVKVVWTDFAIHDLDDIGEYIDKDSGRYAKVVIQNLPIDIIIFLFTMG